MNDNSSREKMYFAYFHPVNVKGNWTYLAQKKSRPAAKINTVFALSLKYFNRIIIKTFLKYLVCCEHQNRVMLFKVLF